MEFTDEKIKHYVKELVTKDSQEALRHLYILFYARLHSFIYYYVRSEENTEEIVSDVFLSIWERRKQLLEIQNFKSYLYAIARNLAVSHLRKESGSQVNLDTQYIDSLYKLHTNPETELIASETMERLNHAVEMLPEKCRQTYRLIREHNLKYKEVSEILNISVKTVEAHLSLAIRKLREVFSKELNTKK